LINKFFYKNVADDHCILLTLGEPQATFLKITIYKLKLLIG